MICRSHIIGLVLLKLSVTSLMKNLRVVPRIEVAGEKHCGRSCRADKAAADVKTLSEGERLRLLSRALITIEEGGGLLGEPTWLRESAEAMDIVQAGGMPVHLKDDEMKAILLEAVKVIRQIDAATKTRRPEEPEIEQR